MVKYRSLIGVLVLYVVLSGFYSLLCVLVLLFIGCIGLTLVLTGYNRELLGILPSIGKVRSNDQRFRRNLSCNRA